MTEKHAQTLSSRGRPAENAGRTPWPDISLGFVRSLADEMDRFFENISLLPDRVSIPLLRRPWRMFPAMRRGRADVTSWAPDVDMFQRGDDLIVRVDLPGLKKDDIVVHITDDGLMLRGEREEHDVDEGVYRRERSFGVIERYISLPEGAITDQAKAHFKDGVLEIVMPAPPAHVTEGRRLEISDRIEKK